MLRRSLDRRTFLKSAGVVGAGVAAGQVCSRRVHATDGVAPAIAPDRIIPTTCEMCGNRCGILVAMKDGRPTYITGNPDHPRSRGKACAKGLAGLRELTTPDRIRQPLKRVADGQYEPISWEQAYAEIGARYREVVARTGPGAVFWVTHTKPTYAWETRLLTALGSPNIFTHCSVCNTARDVGFIATLGQLPSADYGASKYMVFIGRNPMEALVPGQIVSITRAHSKGAKIVVVDPRYNNTAMIADDWLKIRAGTDLALLLAWANVLVTEDLYDAEFVAQYGSGFEQFAAMIQQYTPEWAAAITDIAAETIKRIAREMAAAKPAAFIDPSWHGAFGSQYINSTQTARAVAIVNALLGNINRAGGLIFTKSAKLGNLDPEKYPAPPKPKLPRADGAGEKGGYPLAFEHRGIVQAVPELIEQGKLRVGFMYHMNLVRTSTDRHRAVAALKKLDLFVAIDPYPSETALLAHYILPESLYLERDEMVDGVSSKEPIVAVRQKVVEPAYDTRSAAQILIELAQALGVGEYFNFTLEEYNNALLAPLGLTFDELKEMGIAPAGEKWEEGMPAELKTPSKKIEFFSTRFEEAGYDPLPNWQAPVTAPVAGDPTSFRLIHGHQAAQTHATSTNNVQLMGFTRRYHLERLWINEARAAALGIREGDWVVVSNDLASGVVRAHVTAGIHPESVFLPGSYGRFSPKLTIANGFGLSPNDFMPYA
ncbi:MAG: molybdopterin-dependent oxidoreductase, partial [Roseiflexus sp.]|nr:molybdopterin-dependent oxidoreductase [Roseiflexus sp.]